ncbi:MAG: hypothetical protein Q8S04_08445 [Bacteroidales bacterium]|nr:hypothetical protein [Bacteroidales bacterium]
MVLNAQKAEASASTSTFYKIDVTNCIKCYNCEVVASHSINIGIVEYPYWINGSFYGNYRIYINPPQEYLDDLDETIAGCPMECISKSTHQKRR